MDDVVNDATGIILDAQEQIGMEGIFTLAVRLGVMLNKWSEMMSEQYSKEWVEATGMTLFHKFFTPVTDVQQG